MPRFLLAFVGILAGVVFTWNVAHLATTGKEDAKPYLFLGLGWIVVCSFNLKPGD